MPVTLRIGEVKTIEAVTLDQDGRPSYITNKVWSVDSGVATVAGDPSTPHSISSVSVASPSVVTTADAHGFVTGDRVTIESNAGATPDVNGSHIATVINATSFSIPVNVTVGTGASGVVHRSNAEATETLAGPPPIGYEATLTGQASGAGLLRLTFEDAFLDPGLASLAFEVLNASSLAFEGGTQIGGELILDFRDGTGPGVVPIRAVGRDTQGAVPWSSSFTYALTDFAWTHTGAHLALTNDTTQTVGIEGLSQGNGVLSCTAKNSAGVTISGSMNYKVLSTVLASVTIQEKA